MKKYTVEVTGKTSLLMHADNIAWADQMRRWQDHQPAKKRGADGFGAGDDRAPAYRWIGSLYQDEVRLVIPQRVIMGSLFAAASEIKIGGTGGKNKTYKKELQNVLRISDANWPLLVNGKTIDYGKIKPLMKVDDFDEQCATVEKLGFNLDYERIRCGASKHVRVRPEFTNWGATGEVVVIDDSFSKSLLDELWEIAGCKGWMDNRPNSPKCPGAHGTFTVVVK